MLQAFCFYFGHPPAPEKVPNLAIHFRFEATVRRFRHGAIAVTLAEPMDCHAQCRFAHAKSCASLA